MKQSNNQNQPNQENISKNNTSNRGFASMDEDKQKEIASKGGKAAAEHGDTSNRGFASMDEDKQREIAKKGGERSHKNLNDK